MSNDYHGRIMNLQIDPENVLDGWTRREFGAYKDGHRDARHNAAVIGNDADIELHAARARIAELEAECARLRGVVAVTVVSADTRGGYLEAALSRIAGFACRAPYSNAACGRCESCLARAALATPDAGAATGNAPRSEFNTLGEFLDAQQ